MNVSIVHNNVHLDELLLVLVSRSIVLKHEETLMDFGYLEYKSVEAHFI